MTTEAAAAPEEFVDASDLRRIGEYIRYRRAKLGFSQGQLAAIAGLRVGYLNALEFGRTPVLKSHYDELCEILREGSTGG